MSIFRSTALALCPLMLLAFCGGCETSVPVDDAKGTAKSSNADAVHEAVGALAGVAIPGADASTDTGSAPATDKAAAETDTAGGAKPAGTLVKAAAGVTGKGQYEPGLITTPVSAYFSVTERIVFDIQIPKAMQLFDALNNGRAPQSHEEFMDKIIRENMIVLPDLPPGSEYVYDPAAKQLMVRHPAR